MWDGILSIIARIIEVFYTFAQDWGLAIILFTVVFRLIMLPLMKSQTKSSFMMQKMQPKIAELKKRFPDDPMRVNEETQKIYAEAKFNPLMGCVPLLIQMPIFVALFQVLRSIQDWLPEYYSFTFYNIIPNLLSTPAEAWDTGFTEFIPYAILIVIFVGVTFLPMLLQQKDSQNSQQKNQMLMMAIIMSIMMLFVSWSSPAGVLLFWGVSGVIAVAFQQLYTRHLRRHAAKEEEELIDVMPVQVEVERRQRKKRPTKKR